MKNCRSGMYAWGGPGTVRLLQTKYHSPKIDVDSFHQLYDEQNLQIAKDIFDVSDVWVTYSWGFSVSTELEDRTFIREKLHNFKKIGLRVHLYVQGLNVVEAEYREEDFYCTDPFERRIPYSKGRRLICPNSPSGRNVLVRRVTDASQEQADGVYVDNILFGFPPAFIRSDFAPFFGCACHYCRKEFQNLFSYELSFPISTKQKLKDFLSFRARTITSLVKELSSIARSHGKFFGINLFDPVQMNSSVYFGYDLTQIHSFLDYFLVENHSLPSTGRSNDHLFDFIRSAEKPVFVLSYDKGIGFDSEFTQKDFDSIATEAAQMRYRPCYKVSEYVTNKTWHVLDFPKFHLVQIGRVRSIESVRPIKKLQSSQWYDTLLSALLAYIGIPLVRLYFENRFVNRLGHFFYRSKIYSWQNFQIED